ncbi:MAG TPA: PIN domain-containing protein [Polyangiaceae bacterium]|nr:PIN domain-containing protein [Polyangiaceae bacterium]
MPTRGRPTTRMARLLAGVELEPLDPRLARIADEAMATVRGATTNDAILMASAAQRGDAIFTSDVDDLGRGSRATFGGVRVLHV